MSNAVKFASSRIGVTVSVSPSGDGVRVFVSDDGPGIPADEVGNIFKRFYQVGSQAGGSGLGLNLSSGLARVIGGDLSVDSSEGHGSTFCLLIPAKDMVIVPEEAAENRSADSGAASSGSPLVLVADDNSDMRFFISSALSGSYRVMEAADGKEALQLIVRLIEENISDPEFNVEKLSAQAGISRMQIYRLLKNMVGQVPSEFIKNFRLARAASLIEKGGLNINEISYMVGFGDSKYFSACFKRKYGISPKEYGRKGKSKPDPGLGESVSRSF